MHTKVAYLLEVKAATRNFQFFLIVAAPVDKSGMSTTTSCHKRFFHCSKIPPQPGKIWLLCAMGMCTLGIYTQVN